MIDFQQIATLRRFEPSQRFPDYFNSTTYSYLINLSRNYNTSIISFLYMPFN